MLYDTYNSYSTHFFQLDRRFNLCTYDFLSYSDENIMQLCLSDLSLILRCSSFPWKVSSSKSLYVVSNGIYVSTRVQIWGNELRMQIANSKLSTSLLCVTMNAARVKCVKSHTFSHRCENRYNVLEAVISPAYTSKDYMRDRDNKRISYRGSHHGCQCTSERAMRQVTLFCNSHLIVLPYPRTKVLSGYVESHVN